MDLDSNSYYYSAQQKGIDRRIKDRLVERCLPFISGPHVLDLGFVDDVWVHCLLPNGYKVDIVEGASRHVQVAQKFYGSNQSVRVIHSLFQDFSPDGVYDSVVAGDMIRYVEEPVAFLKKVKSWLKPNGKLVVTVPNCRSLHRRIGTLMGQEAHPNDLSDQDIQVGNLRCYDRYDLRALILESGYRIHHLHGFFLKPLSSSQMMEWSDDLLDAFCQLGDELEDYAWFLYALCEQP